MRTFFTRQWVQILLLSLLHFGVCIFSGALGWYTQMVVVSFMSATAVYLCFQKISERSLASMASVALFFLVYVPASIILASYVVIPIWAGGILLSVLTYRMLKKRWKPVWMIASVAVIILLNRLVVMPNNVAFLFAEPQPNRFSFAGVPLHDTAGKLYTKENFRGKVVVFDVWHSRCALCFEKFPQLEALHKFYQNDSSVAIYALNIPLRADTKSLLQKLTANYSFKKLSFPDQATADSLQVHAAPLLLIFDQNYTCQYAGDLNVDPLVFINNTKRIINRLKTRP